MTQGGDHDTAHGTDGKFIARDGKRLLRKDEYSGPNKTAKAVARQHGIGETTVKQSEKFAKGVDTAEKISPCPLLQWAGDQLDQQHSFFPLGGQFINTALQIALEGRYFVFGAPG